MMGKGANFRGRGAAQGMQQKDPKREIVGRELSVDRAGICLHEFYTAGSTKVKTPNNN